VAGQHGDLAAVHREHWQRTYAVHPTCTVISHRPPAVYAAEVFATGARSVLELGAGHGRDALYFARRGFSVQATDFSPQALGELRRTAEHSCVGDRVAATVP
jgi:methylase of polypeptide subunit release factors